MGWGSQGSSTNNYSTPLTAQEKLNHFNAIMTPSYQGTFGTKLEGANVGSMIPGEYQGLSGGDYDKLQESLVKGNTIGLDSAWAMRSSDTDQDMAKRGLWSSGAGIQAKNRDFATNWMPQYRTAGENAVAQRYALQQQDMNDRQKWSWMKPQFLASTFLGNTGQISSGGSNSSGYDVKI